VSGQKVTQGSTPRRRSSGSLRKPWAYKFALDGVDGAALVEAEYLVAEVQAGSLKAEALVDAIAALDVKLGVGVEVDVTKRTLDSKDGILVGCSVDVGVVVELNVGVVMASGKAHGEARFVIGKAGVPSIGSLPRQSRMIKPSFAPRVRRCEVGRERNG